MHIYLLVLALFLFALLFFMYVVFTKHESPVAAATSLEQNFVDAAKRGEEAFVGAVHHLEAEVVAKLHLAEVAAILKPGTTQAYVDAHTQQVQAAATVASAEAITAATAATPLATA